MKARLGQKFTKSQKYRILCALKRRGSLSVPDLLSEMQLSYMGIKQHCVEMERDGYLLKKRKPRTSGRGRPEQMYELTEMADELFPSHDTILTRQIMAALRSLYGTNAPEKILFTIYQELIQTYRKAIQTMLLEDRIQQFVRLREKDGYLLNAAPTKDGSAWQITESHSPISGLLKEFPILLKFELQIYQKSLHPKTHQLDSSIAPYRIIYEIPEN